MIHAELLRDQRILIITPEGDLQSSDFIALAQLVDPYIEEKGELHGLMVYTQSFPHWENFKALLTHFKFVKNHQHHVRKIAAVSDNSILSIAPSLVTHFIHAEVRHFDYADKDAALAWLAL